MPRGWAEKNIVYICDDDYYDEIAVLSMSELFGSLVGNKQHRPGVFVNPLVVYMTVFIFYLVRIPFCSYPVVLFVPFRVMKDGNYLSEDKSKIKEIKKLLGVLQD